MKSICGTLKSLEITALQCKDYFIAPPFPSINFDMDISFSTLETTKRKKRKEKWKGGKILVKQNATIRNAEKTLSKIANFMIHSFNYFMDSFHPQLPHS